MGWGEPMKPRPGQRLAEAVRRWIAHPTTGNADRVAEELDRFDRGEA